MRLAGRKRPSVSGQFDDPDEPAECFEPKRRSSPSQTEQKNGQISSNGAAGVPHQHQTESVAVPGPTPAAVGPSTLVLIPFHPSGVITPPQYISHGGTQWMVPLSAIPAHPPHMMMTGASQTLMLSSHSYPHPPMLQQRRPEASSCPMPPLTNNSTCSSTSNETESTGDLAGNPKAPQAKETEFRQLRPFVPPPEAPRAVYYNSETKEVIIDHNMPPVEDWLYMMDEKQRQKTLGGYVPTDLIDKRFGLQEHEVKDTDVLCGRGGQANTHPGNIWYRAMVAKLRERYAVTPKHHKCQIARYAVGAVRSRHGRFLKRANDSEGNEMWYEIGDENAKAKTSQTLREGMAKFNRDLMRKKFEEMRSQAQPNSVAKAGVIDSSLQDSGQDSKSTESKLGGQKARAPP